MESRTALFIVTIIDFFLNFHLLIHNLNFLNLYFKHVPSFAKNSSSNLLLFKATDLSNLTDHPCSLLNL
jgi:hypothetical protein